VHRTRSASKDISDAMGAKKKDKMSPCEMQAAPCSHDQTGSDATCALRCTAPAVTGKFGAGLHAVPVLQESFNYDAKRSAHVRKQREADVDSHPNIYTKISKSCFGGDKTSISPTSHPSKTFAFRGSRKATRLGPLSRPLVRSQDFGYCCASVCRL